MNLLLISDTITVRKHVSSKARKRGPQKRKFFYLRT